MNLSTILNTFFLMSAFSAIKDKRRITAVLDCINALNEKDTLTLTGLGRGIKNTKTKVKHCIKRVCRLLGNPHLHRVAYWGLCIHNRLPTQKCKAPYHYRWLVTGESRGQANPTSNDSHWRPSLHTVWRSSLRVQTWLASCSHSFHSTFSHYGSQRGYSHRHYWCWV